jgi:hypothetical protein
LDPTSCCCDSVGSLLNHVLLRPWHLLNQVTWDRLICIKTLLLVVKRIDVVVNVQIPLTLVLGATSLFLRLWLLVVTLPLEIIWLTCWFSRKHSYLFTLVILGCSIHLVGLHRWFHFLVHLVLPHFFLLT